MEIQHVPLIQGTKEFLEKLILKIPQENIGLGRGAKDDLKKLQITLNKIAEVTEDAETKQVKEKAIGLWLRRITDVAYEFEDLLDRFLYDRLRKTFTGSVNNKVRRNSVFVSNSLVFRLKMAIKFKHIRQMFDVLAIDMHMFTISKTVYQCPVDNRTRSTNFYDSTIFGRENAKLEIVNMLLATNSSSSSLVNHNQYENISVIPIVGMGGLGKRTLAQLVYNDTSVQRHFKPRIWVFASNNFDVINKVLKDILESITGTICENELSEDELVRRIHEHLADKKYLIVIDDLWNENIEKWERLRNCLMIGAQGSKILVTTRNDHVASIIRTIDSPYKLQRLSDDDCWSIIKKIAFAPGEH